MTLPIERVDKGRFIAVDDLKPMDLSKRLHVIACGVGLGKSTLVLDAKHGFMDYLRANVDGNLTADDVVFLTPRRILKDNPGVFVRQFDVDTIQGYVQSVMGKDGGDGVFPRVVIIDEVHLLVRESTFCRQMGTLMDAMEHCQRETVWIGLTATNDILEWLGEGLSVEYLTDRLMVKYQIGRTVVANGNSIRTLVADVVLRDADVSPDSKAWVYVESANEGMAIRKMLLEEGVKAAFVCSDANRNYGSSDKDVYRHIAERHAMPDGLAVVVSTSVTEVGITVKDESLKTVVVDSVYPDTIVQVCGRFRNDLDSLYVLNRRKVADVKRTIAGYREAAKFSSNVMNGNYEDRGFMLGYLSRAVEGQGACVLIERVDGSYVLNSRLEDLYSYWLACADAAGSYGRRAEGYYRDALRCYCGGDGPHIEFTRTDRVSIREREVRRISQADISAYLDVELDVGRQVELANLLGVKDPNHRGRVLGIKGLKGYLEDAGYLVGCSHMHKGRRCRVITRRQQV